MPVAAAPSLQRLSLLALIAAQAWGAPPTPSAVAPATDLQPPFNLSPPYLGADIATSIPLSNGSALWLHGDTLVGSLSPDGLSRRFESMPRNSVALRFTNGTLRHAIRPASASNPAHVGFFTPPEPTQWYWPTCGAVLSAQLLVFAMRMADGPPGLFPFVLLGTDVLALGPTAALGNEPLHWPAPAISQLPYLHENLTLGNAVGQDAGTLYLLGGCGSGARAAFVARIPVEDAAAGRWTALQQWSSSGQWEGMGSPTSPPQQLFDFVPSEATLTYHAALGVWVVLTVNTFLSSSITMHTAAAVQGPYTATSIYTIPAEMLAGGAFCYAGKVHPELTPPGRREIVFSVRLRCQCTCSRQGSPLKPYTPFVHLLPVCVQHAHHCRAALKAGHLHPPAHSCDILTLQQHYRLLLFFLDVYRDEYT